MTLLNGLHPSHPDLPRLQLVVRAIAKRLGPNPEAAFVERILAAVDFVLDPARTGRTEIKDLDRVEKTFVGLKVEHQIRDFLGAKPGARDLDLDGISVDIKNTVRQYRAWMIPVETYSRREPVLLIASNAKARTSSMGVMIAHPEYLGAPNRDQKRPVLAAAHAHILWICDNVPWPPSRWEGLDMVRFRQLREDKRSGGKRAADFFRENLGRRIHRSVVTSLLHEQYDPMKRLRGNGGARDFLGPQGIAILSRHYDQQLVTAFGLMIGRDEFMSVRPATPAHEALLRTADKIS